MNVLVTGGAGFIGSHLCHALAEAGHKVVAFDDVSGGNWENLAPLRGDSIVPLQHDCCDAYEVGCAVEAHQIDTLVHCAANARESASQFQPAIVTKRNLYAYMNTLSASVRNGVKRVVCYSSTAVYGAGAMKPPFDETLPLAPEDIYGINKMAMEQGTWAMAHVHDFKAVVLRPHNVFGPKQALHDKFRNVVGIWMNLIMRDEPITIYGDGSQVRAFSFIGDCLPSFLRAVENVEDLHGHAINVGGTIPVTLMELVNAVREAMGAPGHPLVHLPDRPLEVHSVYTTHDKSVRMLDYKEEIGWRAGVIEMAGWAKKQGPQVWKNNDPLELVNEKTPKNWL